ncbi:MAG: TetR/AcrR family transcriptional regulator [Burkholderiales bacterium]
MKSPTSAAQTARKPARASRAIRPYHHGNLRVGLLEAADAVLAERGAQALTLREVARAAGVSHGAPYHHFTSLNDLLAAVAQRGFEALGDAMAQAVAVADTRERLLRVADAYVACARAHPERFRLMFGPLLARKEEHPALQAAAQRAFGFVLAAATAHDKKNGGDLALAGWSLAHGLSHLMIDGAFDGLPMKKQSPDTLARKLSERMFG